MAGFDEKDKIAHESFGSLQVSRVSGDATLFMSPHSHQHYIVLRVTKAELYRNLHHDWMFSRSGPQDTYVEVALSEAQWAHAITSMNMGSGSPCTVIYGQTAGFKKMAEPPQHHQARPTFAKEMRERGEKAIASIETAEKMLADLFAKGKAGKGEIAAVVAALGSARQDATGNMAFVCQSFEENMDTLVEAAKTEIEAHTLAGLHSVALAAVQHSMSDTERQSILDAFKPNGLALSPPTPEAP